MGCDPVWNWPKFDSFPPRGGGDFHIWAIRGCAAQLGYGFCQQGILFAHSDCGRRLELRLLFSRQNRAANERCSFNFPARVPLHVYSNTPGKLRLTFWNTVSIVFPSFCLERNQSWNRVRFPGTQRHTPILNWREPMPQTGLRRGVVLLQEQSTTCLENISVLFSQPEKSDSFQSGQGVFCLAKEPLIGRTRRKTQEMFPDRSEIFNIILSSCIFYFMFPRRKASLEQIFQTTAVVDCSREYINADCGLQTVYNAAYLVQNLTWVLRTEYLSKINIYIRMPCGLVCCEAVPGLGYQPLTRGTCPALSPARTKAGPDRAVEIEPRMYL